MSDYLLELSQNVSSRIARDPCNVLPLIIPHAVHSSFQFFLGIRGIFSFDLIYFVIIFTFKNNDYLKSNVSGSR